MLPARSRAVCVGRLDNVPELPISRRRALAAGARRRRRGGGGSPPRPVPAGAGRSRGGCGRAGRRRDPQGRPLAREPGRARLGRRAGGRAAPGLARCRRGGSRRLRGSLGCADGPGAPEQRDDRAARRLARRRSGDGAEDRRLPPEARRVQLCGRARRHLGDRPGPSRPAAGPRGAVSDAAVRVVVPQRVAAAAALGLGASLVARCTWPALAVGAALAAAGSALVRPEQGGLLVVLSAALARLWWGSARVADLDRSVLLARVGWSET